MVDTGYSQFKMNGVSLQEYRWNLLSMDGVDGMPGRRGENKKTPYQDGDYSFGNKFYASRSFLATMLVLPFDTTGAVTSVDGMEWHLRENFDTLKGLLNQQAGLQTLSFEVKDGVGGGSVVREIDVEMLAPFNIIEHKKRAIEFNIEMFAPRPLWRDLPLITVNETAITATRNFNIDTAGNAPVGDLVITVTANANTSTPTIMEVASGDTITINDPTMVLNDEYIIDLGAKTFTKNGATADTSITRTAAWFMRLPAAAVLAMRGDLTSGDYDLKLEYYKKWL